MLVLLVYDAVVVYAVRCVVVNVAIVDGVDCVAAVAGGRVGDVVVVVGYGVAAVAVVCCVARVFFLCHGWLCWRG